MFTELFYISSHLSQSFIATVHQWRDRWSYVGSCKTAWCWEQYSIWNTVFHFIQFSWESNSQTSNFTQQILLRLNRLTTANTYINDLLLIEWQNPNIYRLSESEFITHAISQLFFRFWKPDFQFSFTLLTWTFWLSFVEL